MGGSLVGSLAVVGGLDPTIGEPSQGSAFDGDSACLARILLGRLAWDLVDALAAVGAEYRFLLAAVTITVTGV